MVIAFVTHTTRSIRVSGNHVRKGIKVSGEGIFSGVSGIGNNGFRETCKGTVHSKEGLRGCKRIMGFKGWLETYKWKSSLQK